MTLNNLIQNVDEFMSANNLAPEDTIKLEDRPKIMVTLIDHQYRVLQRDIKSRYSVYGEYHKEGDEPGELSEDIEIKSLGFQKAMILLKVGEKYNIEEYKEFEVNGN